jgi:hypothetical protein
VLLRKATGCQLAVDASQVLFHRLQPSASASSAESWRFSTPATIDW